MVRLRAAAAEARLGAIDQAQRAAGDQLPIANDALDHVVDMGCHDQLLTVEKSDDGIRRVLDRFDEVGIHDELRAVQARHIDHRGNFQSLGHGFAILAVRGRPTHG